MVFNTMLHGNDKHADDHNRDTSLITDCHPLGPYSRYIPKALRWS